MPDFLSFTKAMSIIARGFSLLGAIYKAALVAIVGGWIIYEAGGPLMLAVVAYGVCLVLRPEAPATRIGLAIAIAALALAVDPANAEPASIADDYPETAPIWPALLAAVPFLAMTWLCGRIGDHRDRRALLAFFGIMPVIVAVVIWIQQPPGAFWPMAVIIMFGLINFLLLFVAMAIQAYRDLDKRTRRAEETGEPLETECWWQDTYLRIGIVRRPEAA